MDNNDLEKDVDSLVDATIEDAIAERYEQYLYEDEMVEVEDALEDEVFYLKG